MSAQTERLEALSKEMEGIEEMQEELRELRKTLTKEVSQIHLDIRSKKLRKRKWVYISANRGSKLWAYGSKVEITRHTRKTRRFTAGAWVQRRGKEQWFSYRDLSPTKPENIGMNRMIAGALSGVNLD